MSTVHRAGWDRWTRSVFPNDCQRVQQRSNDLGTPGLQDVFEYARQAASGRVSPDAAQRVQTLLESLPPDLQAMLVGAIQDLAQIIRCQSQQSPALAASGGTRRSARAGGDQTVPTDNEAQIRGWLTDMQKQGNQVALQSWDSFAHSDQGKGLLRALGVNPASVSARVANAAGDSGAGAKGISDLPVGGRDLEAAPQLGANGLYRVDNTSDQLVDAKVPPRSETWIGNLPDTSTQPWHNFTFQPPVNGFQRNFNYIAENISPDLAFAYGWKSGALAHSGAQNDLSRGLAEAGFGGQGSDPNTRTNGGWNSFLYSPGGSEQNSLAQKTAGMGPNWSSPRVEVDVNGRLHYDDPVTGADRVFDLPYRLNSGGLDPNAAGLTPEARFYAQKNRAAYEANQVQAQRSGIGGDLWWQAVLDSARQS